MNTAPYHVPSADTTDGDLKGFGGTMTQIINMERTRHDSERTRATLSVICRDEPGTLIRFTRWLYDKHQANIVSSAGCQLDHDHHASFITIDIDSESAKTLHTEIKMLFANQIEFEGRPIREGMKLYELTITGPDEPGMFTDICTTLSRDNREINILSYAISTRIYPEYKDITIAHIRMHLEVPHETAGSLPEIIDEIRAIGGGTWKISDRDESAGDIFERLPIPRPEHSN